MKIINLEGIGSVKIVKRRCITKKETKSNFVSLKKVARGGIEPPFQE